GREALKIVEKEKPSLIIMDLVMPKMDGIQAYKALKASADTKHIPIIVYTAQPPEVVVKKGEAAFDVVDFVLKPFDSKTLVLAVKKILNKEG
ncbi:MAG: response regulator, partial [Candidatus Omnitrophota bacterium]